MKFDLPTPNADDLRALRNNFDAMRSALELKSELVRLVKELPPAAFAVFAQRRMPGASWVEALGALHVVVADAQAEVTSFNSLAKAVETEADEAIRPTFEAAVRRLFDLMEKIDRYPRMIDLAKSDSSSAVKALVEAGASQSEAERIAAEKRGKSPDDLELEFSKAKDEYAALTRFVRTKDVADLPAGFSR